MAGAEGEHHQRVAAALLRAHGEFVSGAKVAEALGISRPAVAKHVAALRRLGYEVESVRSRGHRVLGRPDLLLPTEIYDGLETDRLGRAVHHFQVVESTQDIAREMALAGAAEGTIIVAEEQRTGRGRLGRSYYSPPGGIWCSIIMRPRLLPSQAQLLSLAAGLAVAEAVASVCDVQPLLKWPNDLLLADRKVCGILIEMAAEHDLVHYLLLGMGINANIGVEAFPSELRAVATSLQIETGKPVCRRVLLQRLLKRLELRYGQLSSGQLREVLDAWRAWPNSLGRAVRVSLPGQHWDGYAESIDDDGALLVRLANGSIRRAVAGDVQLLPPESVQTGQDSA